MPIENENNESEPLKRREILCILSDAINTLYVRAVIPERFRERDADSLRLQHYRVLVSACTAALSAERDSQLDEILPKLNKLEEEMKKS